MALPVLLCSMRMGLQSYLADNSHILFPLVAWIFQKCLHIQFACLERFPNMTTLELKGNWNAIKGKFKQKYGQLTDNDLVFAEGKEEEMLGRIQARLGKTKEEIRGEIERFGSEEK